MIHPVKCTNQGLWNQIKRESKQEDARRSEANYSSEDSPVKAMSLQDLDLAQLKHMSEDRQKKEELLKLVTGRDAAKGGAQGLRNDNFIYKNKGCKDPEYLRFVS